MRLHDAIDMLADSGVEALRPTIWADLGCGDGTFTLALGGRDATRKRCQTPFGGFGSKGV